MADDEADPPPQRFRCRAKRFFLTYPHCPLDPVVLKNGLEELQKGVLLEWVIATELHESGEPHLHCYLYYESVVDVRDPHAFDIHGYHPNVQSCRSHRAVVRYIQKDGQYIASHDRAWTKLSWGTLLEAKSRGEFFRLVKLHYPRDWALSTNRLRNFAQSEWPDETVEAPCYLPAGYVPSALTDYVAEYIMGPQHPLVRPKSLFIYGPSRTGKTVWATSLGCHSYFGFDFNVDSIVADQRYAVFDDCNYEHTGQPFAWWKPFIGGMWMVPGQV